MKLQKNDVEVIIVGLLCIATLLSLPLIVKLL